jgi:maltooligosyltrehalose synthase
VRGAQARHVCAFARRGVASAGREAATAVVLAPRLLAQLTPAPPGSSSPPPPCGAAVWGDTHVLLGGADAPSWTNLFTGQTCLAEDSRILLAEALADFPLALLTR